MFILDNQCLAFGQPFWRVDNTDNLRVGIENLAKPTVLLLVEDWPREKADALMNRMNAAAEQPK